MAATGLHAYGALIHSNAMDTAVRPFPLLSPPPELQPAHTEAFAFDQSPDWEHGAITPDPKYQFDQACQ